MDKESKCVLIMFWSLGAAALAKKTMQIYQVKSLGIHIIDQTVIFRLHL